MGNEHSACASTVPGALHEAWHTPLIHPLWAPSACWAGVLQTAVTAVTWEVEAGAGKAHCPRSQKLTVQEAILWVSGGQTQLCLAPAAPGTGGRGGGGQSECHQGLPGGGAAWAGLVLVSAPCPEGVCVCGFVWCCVQGVCVVWC